MLQVARAAGTFSRSLLLALCCSASATVANPCNVGSGSPTDLATPVPSFWELPTGSRIAYRKFSHGARSGKPPIIFLHGGPGAYALNFQPTMRMLDALAQSGHEVYAYDQVGGGRSERLVDIREYTVRRHVADLEAVRTAVGAQRVILLGSSWGATLAAHYTARHPNRVAGLILSGPGVIHPGDWNDGYGRIEDRMSASEKDAMRDLLENHPQLEIAMGKLDSDPAEAVRILPDDEGGRLFDQITNRFYIPYLGCPGAKIDVQSNGYGFWANRMTGIDLDRTANPIAKLRTLSVPALILRGSCEYMLPEVAVQYENVLKGQLVTIGGAGHMIWWEKPDEFLSAARTFLSSLR